jgi:hypothetical protein
MNLANSRVLKVAKVALAIGLAAIGVSLVPSGARAGGPFDQEAPIPAIGCTRNSDCQTPLICALGRCRAACVEDRDCSCPGTHCDHVLVSGSWGSTTVGRCAVTVPDAPPKAACVHAFDCESHSCGSGRCL